VKSRDTQTLHKGRNPTTPMTNPLKPLQPIPHKGRISTTPMTSPKTLITINN
jgi:hypothetical protein